MVITFERNIDPKKSIGIGSEVAAITISGVGHKRSVKTGFNQFWAHHIMAESHAIRTLLGVSKGELKNELYKVRKTHDDKWVGLNFYRGKWLRFQNHVYYIPK